MKKITFLAACLFTGMTAWAQLETPNTSIDDSQIERSSQRMITLCDPMTDMGAPMVECTDDIEVSGLGAACSDPVAVEYSLGMISDDCEARLAQNTVEVVNTALDCSGGQQTGHIRVFDLAASGIVNSFVLSQVEVGIWQSFNNPEMTVNIYDMADLTAGLNTFLPPLSAAIDPIATADFTVPTGNQFMVTVPIFAVIEPNTTIMVEIVSPNSIDFLVGYNTAQGAPANQTEVGYIGCNEGNLTYTDTVAINFPDFAAIIIPSGSDLSITQTAGLASGDLFPLGDTMNSFDITDAAGNTTTCAFNVSVGDFDGPDVSGPIDIFTGTGTGGACEAVVTYDPITATDNCAADADITIVQTSGMGSGASFPVGTTTESYTVSDTAGNETIYSFDITITDTTLPSIDCPSDFAVSPDDAGTYTLPDWTTLASDNCSAGTDLTTTQDPAAGTVVDDGSVTEVTITSTDGAGNETVCVFSVTVDASLGLNDLTLGDALSVYPNPTNDTFTLRNGSNSELQSITLMDVNGRIVSELDLSEMGTERLISMDNLASGIYFARISTDTAFTIKRILKK